MSIKNIKKLNEELKHLLETDFAAEVEQERKNKRSIVKSALMEITNQYSNLPLKVTTSADKYYITFIPTHNPKICINMSNVTIDVYIQNSAGSITCLHQQISTIEEVKTAIEDCINSLINTKRIKNSLAGKNVMPHKRTDVVEIIDDFAYFPHIEEHSHFRNNTYFEVKKYSDGSWVGKIDVGGTIKGDNEEDFYKNLTKYITTQVRRYVNYWCNEYNLDDYKITNQQEAFDMVDIMYQPYIDWVNKNLGLNITSG